jgi:hypothetical protein
MWGPIKTSLDNVGLGQIKIPKQDIIKKGSNLSEEEQKRQTEEMKQRILNQSSLAPTENTLSQMFQKIQKEFDGLMLANDSTKFKPTIIDASKSVATSGGGDSGIISPAPVRIDDDTLKLILRKNTHSFA